MKTEQPATASIETVYQRERLGLLRTAYLIVRSQAVAEELVQDGFVRLYQHWETVENPGAFLQTTVVRLCLTSTSRRAMERDRLARADRAPAAGAEHDELSDALDRLDDDRRLALILRFYQDMMYGQIADLLGCPEATARTRVHRGLAELRQVIER